MRPAIMTAGGRYFDITKPEEFPYKAELPAIASALSNLCRFTGHTSSFYSVAQHSVLVSHLLPADLALAGLLHDVSEAFLGDVSTPLKMLLPDYRTIEARVERAIHKAFGLPETLPPAVKEADLIALMLEDRDLMPAHDDVWFDGKYVLPAGFSIVPMAPAQARTSFLARYYALAATPRVKAAA